MSTNAPEPPPIRRLHPRRGDAPPSSAAIPIWIVAAHADACSAEERAVFAERAGAFAAAKPSERLLLVTCHRAELIGTGPLPGELDRVRLAGTAAVASRLTMLTGAAAAVHVFRLAAGLESAIVGEDQVLHQVRELRDASRESARREAPLDPHLSRLLELALGLGRRTRAARFGHLDGAVDAGLGAAAAGGQDAAADIGQGAAGAGPGAETDQLSLAGRAMDWLDSRGAVRSGSRLLVVGAGEIGGLLAVAARRRGASVEIASRSAERAIDLAAAIGGARGMSLEEAAAEAATFDGIAIALAGRWSAAAASASLPPTVDLSSPPSIPEGVAGERLDIDGLFRWTDGDAAAGRDADRYARMAAPLVEDTLDRFGRWCTGRSSVDTLRGLRDRAESSRRKALERLLRRLPDLEPEERELVEAFSQQLTATIIHEPSARLRDDPDGSAGEAARRLFGL